MLRTHSHYLGQLPQTRRRKCWRANCLAQRRSGWRVGELGARSEVPEERRALPRPAGTGQLCAQMQLLQHLPCRGSKPANTLALLWSFPPIGRASWTQGPGQVTPGPPPVLHPTDTSDQVWMATACRPHSPAVTAQPILPDPIATRRSGLGPPQPIYDADPPPKRDKHQNHLLYPPAPPTPAPCWRSLGPPARSSTSRDRARAEGIRLLRGLAAQTPFQTLLRHLPPFIWPVSRTSRAGPASATLPRPLGPPRAPASQGSFPILPASCSLQHASHLHGKWHCRGASQDTVTMCSGGTRPDPMAPTPPSGHHEHIGRTQPSTQPKPWHRRGALGLGLERQTCLQTTIFSQGPAPEQGLLPLMYLSVSPHAPALPPHPESGTARWRVGRLARNRRPWAHAGVRTCCGGWRGWRCGGDTAAPPRFHPDTRPPRRTPCFLLHSVMKKVVGGHGCPGHR